MFMFNKQKDMAHANGNETIIAQGVKVEGDFRSQGDVVIEGEVIGSLKTEKSLRIGPSAVIHADVSAQSAVVAGEVKGNIAVKEKLELLSTSHVSGDIEAHLLSVAEGARVSGHVSMEEKPEKNAKKSKPQEREEAYFEEEEA